MNHPNAETVVRRLTTRLGTKLTETKQAYQKLDYVVQQVLRRHEIADIDQDPERRVCQFASWSTLRTALAGYPVESRLTFLARLYDRAHQEYCQQRICHAQGATISLASCDATRLDHVRLEHCDILFQRVDALSYRVELRPVHLMSFDNLRPVPSLTDAMPSDWICRQDCPGIAIGTGGGGDIVAADLIRWLLLHEKSTPEIQHLVSTRGWTTGSQNACGGKIGIKREVYHHDGAVTTDTVTSDGVIRNEVVPGVYRVKADTTSNARWLETVPLTITEEIPPRVTVVLNQAGCDDIAAPERVDLGTQLAAVIRDTSSFDIRDDTTGKVTEPWILCVDTGGDVFESRNQSMTVQHQDLEVLKASVAADRMVKEVSEPMTMVVCPGVDAPLDASQKAERAGGVCYTIPQTVADNILERLQVCRMNGSDRDRYSKTLLVLQAALRGVHGFAVLPLFDYLVETWHNPFEVFCYIQPCMRQIITMPTRKLLTVLNAESR